ncbi:MAG: hypothetical protein JXI33_01650 [Candidatus Aminicenantes bacterium]|nr:hypothetical protein [Candidatus Aminicenantes bacterium]
MSNKTVDARKFQRIFFSAEDHVVGAASAPEIGMEHIPITYLNLSEGGICFQSERNLCRKLALEQEIVLKNSEPDVLAFLGDIHVRIKHVLDYDMVANVAFGCEFISIPEKVLGEIKIMIAAGMKK